MNTKSEHGQALLAAVLILALIVIGMVIVARGVGIDLLAPLGMLIIPTRWNRDDVQVETRVLPARHGPNLFLAFVLVLVALLMVFHSGRAMSAHDTAVTGGGDCYAHEYQGDTWAVGNSWYCGVIPAVDKPAKHNKEDGNVVDTADTIVPAVDNPPAIETVQETDNGNPGNDKPVGNAGEKCDKSMCENADNTSGEHGKSNQD